MSIQLAFLSRNLVCSFDFRSIAEQFFSWMDADSLLQQFFNHLKESVYFSALRGVGFSCFGGPWVGNLFSWRMQWECSNFQIFRPNFGVHFWGSILGPWKEKWQESVPKNWSQNWLPKPDQKFQYFSNALPPSRAKRLQTQCPQKYLHPRSRKFIDSLKWLKIVGANSQCPSNWKIVQQRENQMNIPNFCSRMLVEHSNLKPKLSASLL